jgi:hypothetical protein
LVDPVSRSQRDKGARVEREIVNAHRAIGLHAERVPLSGASRYQGNGADIDVHVPWRSGPLVGECKARGSGEGFAVIERWLGENDFLVLKRNNAPPMYVVPERVWNELLLRKEP